MQPAPRGQPAINVNVVNNNAADLRADPEDPGFLHWYIPVATPVTRRLPRAPCGGLLLTVAAWGARASWLPVVRHLARRAELTGLLPVLRETLRDMVHTSIGRHYHTLTLWESLSMFSRSIVTSFRNTAAFTLTDWIYRATAPNSYRQALLTLLRHRHLVNAALTTLAVAGTAWSTYQLSKRVWLNNQPFEPEGMGHPGLMVEVTQEEALGTPTHFACPAGLRATILEKIMLCERTPNLIQKVKSMAGRWCDDNNINPYHRPACIAGAVAVGMTVSPLESDLIKYESRWEVQAAQHRIAQHAAGNADGRPRHKQSFWDWLTAPGRR